MHGMTCIVTGANTGIGYETALALAHLGARVILVCRTPEKGKDACIRIAKASGNPEIHVVTADLSSQKAVRAAAAEILSKWSRIDVLINNAGTWLSQQVLTEDGIETQFAVNQLTPFLLTHLLFPAIKAAPEGRILVVGSDSHFQTKIHFGNLNLDRKYHGLRAYAQSKLANCHFIYELDRKLKAAGITHVTANCIQPGLVKTDIGVKHTGSFHALAWKIRRSGGVTPAEGAETSIFLATSEEVSGIGGLYWDKCKPKKSSKRSYKEEDSRRLWDICEELCGIEGYLG